MAGGYDTASYIYDVYTAADAKYGTPNYWIRYFSPSPNGTVNSSSSHANTECRAAWDSGGKYLSPISSPAQSRLSGTSAQGLADAQVFVSALHNVWLWVTPLDLPTNGVLYCWLDQEQSTSLSTAYWGGWEGYINSYNWPNRGYPLYASLYCNPCTSGHSNCSTVASVGGCYAVWSSVPEPCGYSLRNLPSWNAKTCASCVSNGPSTVLWQFAEAGVCSLTVNVDMDDGAISANSFFMSSRP
jgi:hypothetical protein